MKEITPNESNSNENQLKDSEDDSLSTLTLILIIVGGVCCLLLIGVVVVLVLRSRSTTSVDDEPTQNVSTHYQSLTPQGSSLPAQDRASSTYSSPNLNDARTLIKIYNYLQCQAINMVVFFSCLFVN